MVVDRMRDEGFRGYGGGVTGYVGFYVLNVFKNAFGEGDKGVLGVDEIRCKEPVEDRRLVRNHIMHQSDCFGFGVTADDT